MFFEKNGLFLKKIDTYRFFFAIAAFLLSATMLAGAGPFRSPQECYAEETMDLTDGCLIGYEKGALALLKLPGFDFFKLADRDGRYESPVFAPPKNQLYHIDKNGEKIVRRYLDSGNVETVYRHGGGREMKWLLFERKSYRMLYFFDFKPGRPPHRMMELDTETAGTRVVFEGNLYPYQRPEWGDEGAILFLTYQKGEPGSLVHHLARVDVADGTVETVLRNAGKFAMSTSKEKILVEREGAFRVYRNPGFAQEKKIASGILNDKGGIDSPVCFIGDKSILYWKWLGRNIGLGTYVYDVEKDKSVRKTGHMLWDMYFEKQCLATQSCRK